MSATVLWDMDGVLADFVGGSLVAHGASLPPKDVVWDFPTQIGFASSAAPEFWERLSNRPFWADLPLLPDGMAAFAAVAAVLPRERVGFLSSGLCPGSCDGKRDWLAKHLPGWEKRAAFLTVKEMVAHPNCLLVDDHGPNVDKFRAAGGRAVLVPRPWNDRRGETCGRGLFDHGTLVAEILELAG